MMDPSWRHQDQQPGTESAGPAPAGGDAIPGVPGTGKPGPGAGQPVGGPSKPAGGFDFITIMVVMVVVMLLFTTLGGGRERKRRAALMASVKKHDRVQTTAGIIGTVVEMKGDEIVLRVDEGSNTKIRFAKSAIAQVLKESPVRESADAAEEKPVA